MVSQLSTPIAIEYPDSDGQPMSDNTKQFRWITTIKYNLDWLFAHDPQVFVAGDLLWYPIEGDPKRRVAPDTMVVFGRPKGDRGSYKQWEEDNIPPQVVFEILSPGNHSREMANKLAFYERHNVDEYYLYDPEENTLEGWERRGGYLTEIEPIQDWVSPRLMIRFDLNTPPELQIYQPNGQPFLTFEQISERLEIAQQALEETQQALETTQDQLQSTQQELLAAQELNLQLMQKLQNLGIDPNHI